MRKRDAAIQGTASFIATTACLVISVELYEDLTEGKHHFRLPCPVKLAALCGFAFWAVLEVQKVRRHFDSLLGTRQAWAALRAQTAMLEGMRDWKPIGPHEHPQLSSEPE